MTDSQKNISIEKEDNTILRGSENMLQYLKDHETSYFTAKNGEKGTVYTHTTKNRDGALSATAVASIIAKRAGTSSVVVAKSGSSGLSADNLRAALESLVKAITIAQQGSFEWVERFIQEKLQDNTGIKLDSTLVNSLATLRHGARKGVYDVETRAALLSMYAKEPNTLAADLKQVFPKKNLTRDQFNELHQQFQNAYYSQGPSGSFLLSVKAPGTTVNVDMRQIVTIQTRDEDGNIVSTSVHPAQIRDPVKATARVTKVQKKAVPDVYFRCQTDGRVEPAHSRMILFDMQTLATKASRSKTTVASPDVVLETKGITKTHKGRVGAVRSEKDKLNDEARFREAIAFLKKIAPDFLERKMMAGAKNINVTTEAITTFDSLRPEKRGGKTFAESSLQDLQELVRTYQ